jgi:hypothetical protein
VTRLLPVRCTHLPAFKPADVLVLVSWVQAIEDHRDDLGEPFLASCFAYLQKASDDSLDEIVHLIQRILQMYAARQWTQVDAAGQHDALLQDVLTSDPENWEDMITSLATSGVTPHKQRSL